MHTPSPHEAFTIGPWPEWGASAGPPHRSRRGWVRRVSGQAVGVLLLALFAVLSIPLDGMGGEPLQAVGAASPARPAFNNADGKPNVILFLTDDQALSDLRAMGAVRRRIGQAGTRFSRAFSQYPLCCPARATLLTGQYAHNHGVMGNAPPFGGFPAFNDRETLPVWLQRAGYNTLMLGTTIAPSP